MADEQLTQGGATATFDITTALTNWMKTNATLDALGNKDKNVKMRNLLAVDYSRSQPADLTTMLSRLIKNRT